MSLRWTIEYLDLLDAIEHLEGRPDADWDYLHDAMSHLDTIYASKLTEEERDVVTTPRGWWADDSTRRR